MKYIHVVPVGGREPVHLCAPSCWCQPWNDGELLIHHAKDLREARERFGRQQIGEHWLVIEQQTP